MSERRPFREVKLQWLELLSCDAELSDCGKCVALHIVTRYINGYTEEAWPSYQTIANAIGKSVKTIQRAIHDLELGGWFDVVRGNGSRVSTRYRPSENSIVAACEAREKTDKIVTLNPSKGRQNCPKRQSNLSFKGGQKCPTNKENLINKKINTREAASPPLLEARRPIPAIFISETDTDKLNPWREWLKKNNLLTLELIGKPISRNGNKGFILPSNYPPSNEGDERHHDYLEYLKNHQEFITETSKVQSRLAS